MSRPDDKVQVPMRLDPKLRERIRRQAAGERRTLNAVLEAAVVEYLDRHKEER